MLGALARRLFGSANDRLVKSMRKTVDQINALEPATSALDDTPCAPRRTSSGSGWRGRDPGRPAGRGVRGGARGRQAHPAAAPFRRAADRRHGAAPGRHRRDEDRRGQDAGRDAGRLPQRARGQGRARRHRQRLPGPPRRRLDGRHLPLAGHERGRDRARARRCRAPRGLCLRHHLRHQQRVRLRLPARQHAPLAGRHGAARAPLRHRRRGRL